MRTYKRWRSGVLWIAIAMTAGDSGKRCEETAVSEDGDQLGKARAFAARATANEIEHTRWLAAVPRDLAARQLPRARATDCGNA
jgi:hypothetical protein